MTKVDIFSGFLGAGKTTLIKKLISEAYAGQRLVLIENEFGKVGIDGGFMQEAGIQVNELNSGCICCSLVGDFKRSLTMVLEQYAPDRILIEPSGVGKLSDIINAVSGVEGIEINSATAVADAARCKMYLKNFGEFYADQIAHAGAIVLSRTGGMDAEKLSECAALLRLRNPDAVIITTPWDELDGAQLLAAIEKTDTLQKELAVLKAENEHHHHHHDDDEEECSCGHHHHDDDDDEECTCGHHHHDDDDEEECTCGHHHHDDDDDDDDEECSCGQHHHHDHDADDIFTSWGIETPRKYSEAEINAILAALDDGEKYGAVLRAKGIVDSTDGKWIHFDHVPGEAEVRRGGSSVTGRLCVIGSDLNEKALAQLFGV